MHTSLDPTPQNISAKFVKFAIYTFETEHWNRILFINKEIETIYIKTFTNILESINCSVNTKYIKDVECDSSEAKNCSVYISFNANEKDIFEFIDNKINAYNIFQNLLTEQVKDFNSTEQVTNFRGNGYIDKNWNKSNTNIYPINLQKIPENNTKKDTNSQNVPFGLRKIPIKDDKSKKDLGDKDVDINTKDVDIKDKDYIDQDIKNKNDLESMLKGYNKGNDKETLTLSDRFDDTDISNISNISYNLYDNSKLIRSDNFDNSLNFVSIQLILYHKITDTIILIEPSKTVNQIIQDFDDIELIYTIKNNDKLLKTVKAIYLEEKFIDIIDAKKKINDLASTFDTLFIDTKPSIAFINSITEYINFNYIITDNKNDKIKAHSLLTEIIENVTDVPEEKKLQNDLANILSTMNIKKRRLKDGMYYYGLVNKSNKKIEFSENLTEEKFTDYLNERYTAVSSFAKIQNKSHAFSTRLSEM